MKVSQLRQSVETLEKELADRDVLLESQNEKIGDLSKDLEGAKKKMEDAMVDKGTVEIRNEVRMIVRLPSLSFISNET